MIRPYRISAYHLQSLGFRAWGCDLPSRCTTWYSVLSTRRIRAAGCVTAIAPIAALSSGLGPARARAFGSRPQDAGTKAPLLTGWVCHGV